MTKWKIVSFILLSLFSSMSYSCILNKDTKIDGTVHELRWTQRSEGFLELDIITQLNYKDSTLGYVVLIGKVPHEFEIPLHIDHLGSSGLARTTLPIKIVENAILHISYGSSRSCPRYEAHYPLHYKGKVNKESGKSIEHLRANGQ